MYVHVLCVCVYEYACMYMCVCDPAISEMRNKNMFSQLVLIYKTEMFIATSFTIVKILK